MTTNQVLRMADVNFPPHWIAFTDLLAGGMGATAAVYVGHPLDTVKVKLQTFPSLYTGMTSCFLTTMRDKGIRGLYAGAIPALTATIAENSVLFASYGICQRIVANSFGYENGADLPNIYNAMSGSSAAFFAAIVLCPTELIKCKLQAMHEINSTMKLAPVTITPWQLTRSTLEQEGIKGLFRGFWSTVAREMPGYFFFFGTYEALSRFIGPSGKSKEDIGIFKTIFCGGAAGMAFWVSVYPTDVIKSRIQISTSSNHTRILTEILLIHKTEGLRGFYKGLTPTVLRTYPATGALFLVYEYTKKILNDIYQRVIK